MSIHWTKERIGLGGTLFCAAGLWYVTFSLDAGNFWLKISCSAAFLALVSSTISWNTMKQQFHVRKSDLVIGVVSACVLYLIFGFGNFFLTLLFDSAKASIQSVYAPREGFSAWGIALLLLFVTSPAEEIFWRGFVQRTLMRTLSPSKGFLMATLCYVGVHVWTLNLPLILAAFVAGFFWGILYIWRKSLIPGIISHAAWSVTVFLIFPFH